MPQLLKKVQGEILTNVIGNVRFVTSVYGQIQMGLLRIYKTFLE